MLHVTAVSRRDVCLRCHRRAVVGDGYESTPVVLPPIPTIMVEYGPRILEEEWACRRMWEVWHLLPGGNYHCHDAEELFVRDEEG